MGTKAVSGASGKHGRAFTGSSLQNEFCVTDWSLTEMAQEEETTNSCSAGTREYEYGIRHCEGTLEIDLDLAAHPFGDPPALVTGTKIKLRLFEHSNPASVSAAGSGTYWDFTQVGISQVAITNPQSGKVHYSVQWKSCATYTRPHENTTSSGA